MCDLSTAAALAAAGLTCVALATSGKRSMGSSASSSAGAVSRPRYTHISHRGGAAEQPENTMAAFRAAVDRTRTDMLELDVHLTKDGVVVVAHDDDLHRLTGEKRLISETDFSDLPRLKSTLDVTFVRGAQVHVATDDDHSRIARLEDVFREFPGVGVNIDIKKHDSRLVQAVSDLIDKYSRHDRTVWGNFSAETTWLCHATNPRVGLLFSLRRVLILLVLHYTCLLPFVDLPETHLEIPMPTIFIQTNSAEMRTASMGRFRRLIVRAMDALLMRRSLFAHLAERGIQTYVWVLNTDDEFKRAFECGVTGVMTDYPTRLRDFLNENPQYLRN